MLDLERLTKDEIMMHFEECIAGIRMKTARLGTSMGTPSEEMDMHEFTKAQEQYAKAKTEILRRMP